MTELTLPMPMGAAALAHAHKRLDAAKVAAAKIAAE